MREQISQSISQSVPQGVLITQVFVTGIVRNGRHITPKVHYGRFAVVLPVSLQSGKQPQDGGAANVFRILHAALISAADDDLVPDNVSDERSRVVGDDLREEKLRLAIVPLLQERLQEIVEV